MGLWQYKIPIEVVDLQKKELWAIDSRIAPVKGEYTLLKKRASAVAWNLYDIDAKFADVHAVDDCVKYLEDISAAALAAE